MYFSTARIPVLNGPEISGGCDPTRKFLPIWVVRPKSILLVTEAAMMIAMLIVATVAANHFPNSLPMSLGLVVGLAGCQIGFFLTGIDRLIVDPNPSTFLRSIFGSMLTGLTLAVLLISVFPPFSSGCSGALTAWILSALLVVALRSVIQSLIRHHHMLHTILVVGSDELTDKLFKELSSLNTIVDSPDLETLAANEYVSRIVVVDPHIEAREELAASLIDSKLRGIRIEPAIESCEKLCRKIWIAGLRADWLLYTDGFMPTRLCLALKRGIDIACSLILLILAGPLMAISALVVKFTSPGPFLYRQERVGLHGKTFFVFKLRTMSQEAEARTGPTWAARNDNRITPIGRILRKYRIDELPQLFNVLRGEMSFVGPRPERPYFVDQLKQAIPYYDLRHYVRPGITGWAQVMYPYGSSIADSYEKLQYDLYYIKHLSILLDVMILPKTLKVILSGSGC